MDNKKPLAGIKVVELTTYLAAPVSGRILADWGAEVIKIESPEGDPWRYYGPGLDVPATDEENPVFDIPNANKKSLMLNLKDPQGLKILHQLLADADVFITNNRLSPLRKMGLDYDTLKEKYPRLIYGLVTGYGEDGPDVNKPGFDTASYWAAGGFIADMRIDNPGSYPIYTPAGVADICCGSILFGGLCAALMVREKTGLGDKISISLFGSAVWTMGIMNTITQEKYGYKYPKKRYDSNAMAVCFECADGEWIMLTALNYNKEFPVLAKVLGLEELIGSPEYKDKPSMMQPENKGRLVKLYEERFITKTSAEWGELLTSADVVHSILGHFKDISTNEQARANHFVEEVTFRNGTKAWMPRPSLLSDNLGLPDYCTAPPLGEDSKAILTGLGYSPEEIKAMAEEKITKVR